MWKWLGDLARLIVMIIGFIMMIASMEREAWDAAIFWLLFAAYMGYIDDRARMRD